MDKIEKQTGSFHSFDGLEVYFETRGSGEPIVFIYGIACLMNHWHHQMDYFSKSYKTICVDMRGHNKTPRPSSNDNLSINAIAKDLVTLLEKLSISKAHFIGHSFGCQVLFETYKIKPDLFSSIVLINGFASNPIENMFGIGVVEKIFHFINNRFKKDPDLWKSLWKSGIESPFILPLTALTGGFNIKLTSLKDIQIYTRGVANMDLGVFLKLFEEMMLFNGDDILSQITVPTLIISGENDRVTPKSFQLELAQKIKKAEMQQVPYGSHCTQLDFPDFINLRIEKFYSDF
jgi:pimeloyl-ACP methyl ester carboxylesterase